jgi:hypothetical protein
MKYFSILAILVSLVLGQSAHASGAGSTGTRGGGDAYVAEFMKLGYEIRDWIGAGTLQAGVSQSTFEMALTTTRVESTDEVLIVDGLHKDAVNEPGVRKITINRARWKTIASVAQKRAIVFHEYAGILGLGDSDYRLSSRLFGLVPSVRTVSAPIVGSGLRLKAGTESYDSESRLERAELDGDQQIQVGGKKVKITGWVYFYTDGKIKSFYVKKKQRLIVQGKEIQVTGTVELHPEGQIKSFSTTALLKFPLEGEQLLISGDVQLRADGTLVSGALQQPLRVTKAWIGSLNLEKGNRVEVFEDSSLASIWVSGAEINVNTPFIRAYSNKILFYPDGNIRGLDHTTFLHGRGAWDFRTTAYLGEKAYSIGPYSNQILLAKNGRVTAARFATPFPVMFQGRPIEIEGEAILNEDGDLLMARFDSPRTVEISGSTYSVTSVSMHDPMRVASMKAGYSAPILFGFMPGRSAKFQEIHFHENGKISEGTIEGEAMLDYEGSSFRVKNAFVYSAEGHLAAFYLAAPARFRVAEQQVLFATKRIRSGHVEAGVFLHPNGSAKAGVLAEGATLKMQDGTSRWFAADTWLNLDAEGRVRRFE